MTKVQKSRMNEKGKRTKELKKRQDWEILKNKKSKEAEDQKN